MRILRFLLPLLMVAGLAVAIPSSATTPHYYLALGDSLSRGFQPGLGDTDQGYTDDLYATLHAKDPSLVLEKFGCSGETTGSMINGGVCAYSAGSQLKAAVAFIKANKANISYVTLDIGANDVDSCAPGGSIDAACVTQGLVTIGQNIATILAQLTAADSRLPLSVGMGYYDPFLEFYLTGTEGQAVAVASVGLLTALNSELALAYTLAGFRFADVAAAFDSADFLKQVNVAGYGTLPAAVANICTLTYMCSVKNIHANPTGYQLIAQTFAKTIG